MDLGIIGLHFLVKGVVTKTKYLSQVAIGLAALFLGPSVLASDLRETIVVNTYADSFTSTNITPIKSIIDDSWETEVNDGADAGISKSNLGAFVQYGAIQLGVESRYDFLIHTNEDTARLYKYAKTKSFETTEKYQLDIEYQMLRARSFWIGAQIPLYSNFTITNRLYLWHPTVHRNSTLQGEVIDGVNIRTSGYAELEEFYTYRNILKRPENYDWAKGKGVSWNLGVNWQITPDLSVELILKDVYSRFIFDNIGYSRGELKSDTTYRDDNNILRFNPVYSGVESTRRYRYRPKQTSIVKLRYVAEYADLYFNYRHIFNTYTSSIFGAEKTMSIGKVQTSIRLGADLENKAIELGFGRGNFVFNLLSDSLNLDDAKTFGMSVSYSHSF